MHFKYKNANGLKVKGRKRYIMLTPFKCKLKWLYITSNNVDFRAKNITKDKKGNFIVIKDLLKGHNNSKCICL